MKRVVLVALVLMLCVGALADSGIDWTQYPDDELQSTIDDLTEMINEARAELDSRKVQTVVGIGISTQKLLDDFQAYRKTANLQQYSTFLLPSEKDASSVIVQISDYCWINIRQDNGQVVSFNAIARSEDTSQQAEAEKMADALISFCGLLAVSNPEIEISDAIDVFNGLVQSLEETTIGNVTYRFITASTVTTNYMFEAKPAN